MENRESICEQDFAESENPESSCLPESTDWKGNREDI